jgi:hypothetical protein
MFALTSRSYGRLPLKHRTSIPIVCFDCVLQWKQTYFSIRRMALPWYKRAKDCFSVKEVADETVTGSGLDDHQSNYNR